MSKYTDINRQSVFKAGTPVALVINTTPIVGGTPGEVLIVGPTNEVAELPIDTTPTNGSTNLIDSNAVFDGLATKQDTLVSGTNIKTVQSTTILGSGDVTITDANLSTSDITTNNVSTSKHGFAPKLPNNTTQFLRGDGTWASPAVSVAVQTVTSSATVTPTSDNDLVVITAQATGLTLANPTGAWVQGEALMIRIKDNGTPRSIAYGTNYRAIGVTLPTTTVANKTTYLGIIYNSTDTKWDVIGVTTEA